MKKFAGKTIRVSPEDTEVPVRYHHSSGPFQSGVWIETLISFELDSPLIIKEMKDALDNVREIVNQHFQSKQVAAHTNTCTNGTHTHTHTHARTHTHTHAHTHTHTHIHTHAQKMKHMYTHTRTLYT